MTQILVLASCIYVSVLAAAIYFTRAGARRIAGALAGGVAVAILGLGVGSDSLISRAGGDTLRMTRLSVRSRCTP